VEESSGSSIIPVSKSIENALSRLNKMLCLLFLCRNCLLETLEADFDLRLIGISSAFRAGNNVSPITPDLAPFMQIEYMHMHSRQKRRLAAPTLIVLSFAWASNLHLAISVLSSHPELLFTV